LPPRSAIVHDPDGSDKSFVVPNATQKLAVIAKLPAFWQQPALLDSTGLPLSIRLAATPNASGTLSIQVMRALQAAIRK
jgi:hypothetical protein